MKKRLAYLGAAFLLPALAFADTVNSVQSLAKYVGNLINTIFIPLLFTISFAVFLFGIFRFFILGRGDEENRKKGQDAMIWGIIGFVVMLSVWGLVNIVRGSLPLDPTVPAYPTTPYQ